MLIIFDVDGTLIGGESVDYTCFRNAFHEVTGSPFPEGYFDTINEVTAQAIVHQALPSHSPEDRKETEHRVREQFLENLSKAHAAEPEAFQPMPGALEILTYLDKQDDLSVAIATGDWIETISFKLGAAKVDLSAYPMATSSDCYARADIIRLAAERAGFGLDQVLYVGDALWDHRATQQLGIPFLGVGVRYDKLRENGVAHVLPTLEPEAFSTWFDRFRAG